MGKRVFFAINLPENVRQDLARVNKELGRLQQDRKVVWVHEPNFHITLRFIGESTDQEVKRLGDAAMSTAQKIVPFEITTGALECLPDKKHPRVLAVGAHDNGQMANLAHIFDRELRAAGFAERVQPWRAHITLARIKDDGGTGDFVAAVLPPHVISVSSFELMESMLGPTGPTYRIQHSYQFRELV